MNAGRIVAGMIEDGEMELSLVSAGRLAYEEDVRRCPNYDDGTPRKRWDQLTSIEQFTWRQMPKPRDYSPKDYR